MITLEKMITLEEMITLGEMINIRNQGGKTMAKTITIRISRRKTPRKWVSVLDQEALQNSKMIRKRRSLRKQLMSEMLSM